MQPGGMKRDTIRDGTFKGTVLMRATKTKEREKNNTKNQYIKTEIERRERQADRARIVSRPRIMNHDT